MKMQENKKGFTLLELIVALSIFLVLVAISGNFIINGMQLKRSSYARVSATEEAQKLIKNFMGEIRNASPSDSGDYALDSVGDFEFSFYSNFNNDSQVERLRYFLDGNDFKRGVIVPVGDPLEYLEENETISVAARFINNGDTPIFTYFDGNNNLLENPADNIASIRMVGITFKINPNFKAGDKDFVLSSRIQLRNLKDNL